MTGYIFSNAHGRKNRQPENAFARIFLFSGCLNAVATSMARKQTFMNVDIYLYTYKFAIAKHA
nr:hypothetical protein [uncultured Kingella sp.]